MQRPLLNPTIFDDPDRQPLPTAPIDYAAPVRWARQIAGGIARAGRFGGRLLLTRIGPSVHGSGGSDNAASVAERTLQQRGARLLAAVIFRLLLLAALLLATVGVLTYSLAYPPRPAEVGAPLTGGVFTQPLALSCGDGVSLRAYLTPALDEHRVLRAGERAARAVWPAAVLVPDQREDGHALDPLIPLLHKAGVVVLTIQPRGIAGDGQPRTFGLRERHDVAAGVAYLRSLGFIDRERITIIATGSGATAALLADRDGVAINRLVLHTPVRDFDSVLDPHVTTPWLRPFCRWAFQTALDVEPADLAAAELLASAGSRVLLLDEAPARHASLEHVARAVLATAD